MSSSKKRTCCILCGRPFKQSSGKRKNGHNYNQQAFCSVCRKKKKDINNKVYKKTNGKVKFVSFKDLVRVKNRIGNQDVFSYIEDNPFSIYINYKETPKNIVSQKHKEMNYAIKKDNKIHDIPPYIKEVFGKDKIVTKVSNTVYNPLVFYHCCRCNEDFKVY